MALVRFEEKWLVEKVPHTNEQEIWRSMSNCVYYTGLGIYKYLQWVSQLSLLSLNNVHVLLTTSTETQMSYIQVQCAQQGAQQKNMWRFNIPRVSKVRTHDWFCGWPNLWLQVSLWVLMYLWWAYLKHVFHLEVEGRYLIRALLQAYWKNAHIWLCYSWAETAVRKWKRFYLWWRQAAKGN